jgi:hypothetical protein
MLGREFTAIGPEAEVEIVVAALDADVILDEALAGFRAEPQPAGANTVSERGTTSIVSGSAPIGSPSA